MNKEYLENIVKKVLLEMENEKPDKNKALKKECRQDEVTTPGIFATIELAIEKARQAQAEYEKCPLEERRKIIGCLRENLLKYVEEMAQMTVEETGMGKVQDKIKKNILSIEKTPGVEDLATEVFTGDNGLALVELSPFGVIGSVTPVTNPAATIINNTISALAAGNAIVFCPHPAASQTSKYVIKLINSIMEKIESIPGNLVTAARNTSKENVDVLFGHKDISLLLVTGGTEIVNKALRSGKKTIGAGAGNPPVIVDETADIPAAAKSIVNGASFDNNILCIAEKSILAVEDITDYLVFCMEKEGALSIGDRESIEKLEKCLLSEGKPEKRYIGKDASFILREAGVEFEGNPRLIVVETDISHPFVKKEMMMPLIPVVRQKDFQKALKMALYIENGLKHTAIVHSQNVTRLSEGAKAMKTTIFVKNAPSYAGLGFTGEGYTGFTIAGVTGEGIVSAKDLARYRRCVLAGSFSIR